MVSHIDGRASLAILALVLGLSPVALAVPGDGTQEAKSTQEPAQTQPDNRSYLPPWMQKQEVAGISGRVGDGKSAAEPDALDPNNPAAKQKAKGPTPQRKHRNDFHLFPGLRFFGF